MATTCQECAALHEPIATLLMIGASTPPTFGTTERAKGVINR
jgi:hypothetical protein